MCFITRTSLVMLVIVFVPFENVLLSVFVSLFVMSALLVLILQVLPVHSDAARQHQPMMNEIPPNGTAAMTIGRILVPLITSVAV